MAPAQVKSEASKEVERTREQDEIAALRAENAELKEGRT